MPASEISFMVAFAAGILSFLSPCVLPLVPSYLSYLTGATVADLTRSRLKEFRLTMLLNATSFIAGFSLIFTIFGLSASAIGALLLRHQALVQKLSGLIIIFFGLHMAGVLNVGLLNREKRVHFKPGQVGILKSFLMGIAFSAGWTPCIGPVLGSILILAGNSASMRTGAFLLVAYSMGLAVPFLAAAFSLGWLIKGLKQHAAWLPVITKASGWVMVVAGILVFTGIFARLSSLLPSSF